MKPKNIIATSTVMAVVLPLLYLLYFRGQVIPATQGEASGWLQFIIDQLYPRLATERHRFAADFFLQKADQVVIRFSLVSLSLSLILWLYQKKEIIRNSIEEYFGQEVGFKAANSLISFLYLYLLYTSWDFYQEHQLLSGIQDFYTPAFPLKYLYPYFPTPIVAGIAYGLFILSALLCAFRIKPFYSSLVTILSFLFLYSLRMGFEKTDHGFATITYALVLMPFLMWAYEVAKKNGKDKIEAWSIQLIKIVIPMCYFMAALEKLLSSGIWWLKAENFKTLLYLHQEPLGLWIMKSNVLCTALPLLAWLFQLCFISVLKWPRLVPYFLIIGILFHQGTYFLFGAGDPFTPWIAVYVFFLIKMDAGSSVSKISIDKN